MGLMPLGCGQKERRSGPHAQVPTGHSPLGGLKRAVWGSYMIGCTIERDAMIGTGNGVMRPRAAMRRSMLEPYLRHGALLAAV